jgi:hypothetical protein
VDVTLRPKKKKAAVDQRQLQLPLGEFVPGWKGKRYLLCSDGVWHLVLEIRADYVAETQCGADVTVAQQEEHSQHPMCSDCAAIQGASWKDR